MSSPASSGHEPQDAPERLLLVEDDVKLSRALEQGLQREGYGVDVSRTAGDGLAAAMSGDYSVVVLDLMLPDGDGFAVCEELRRRGRWMPVLMLTARGEVGDRIEGLDRGADDYLVKPFDFGELLARLRALIRRGPSEQQLVLTVGDLRVDRPARAVSRAGREIDLSEREFVLLEFLARNAGRVVTRRELLDEVWSGAEQMSPNLVDVYVGYLRKKLERPFGRELIHTVRGVGFLLEP